MTNSQRKTVMKFLDSQGGVLKEWVNEGRLETGDTWLIGSDRLPVSFDDGSCASINEHLVDPFLFDMLLESVERKRCVDLFENTREAKWDWKYTLPEGILLRGYQAGDSQRRAQLDLLYKAKYKGLVHDPTVNFGDYSFTFRFNNIDRLDKVTSVIANRGYVKRVSINDKKAVGDSQITVNHVRLVDEAIGLALSNVE